jgi:hypothetical protein
VQDANPMTATNTNHCLDVIRVVKPTANRPPRRADGTAADAATLSAGAGRREHRHRPAVVECQRRVGTGSGTPRAGKTTPASARRFGIFIDSVGGGYPYHPEPNGQVTSLRPLVKEFSAGARTFARTPRNLPRRVRMIGLRHASRRPTPISGSIHRQRSVGRHARRSAESPLRIRGRTV